MMFCGLMSRWMIWFLCATSRPMETWIAMLMVSFTESRAFFSIYFFKVMPSTSSMPK